MTTPFEREILTHHYVSPAPFDRQSEVYWQTVDGFVTCGLLFRDGDTVSANQIALKVYMDALGDVPLPTRTWIVRPLKPFED